ncbi:MAG: class I SAM-dependent methyltransferase [Rudaea sp.]
MKDFYEKFYAATEHSLAHADFCERVFGADLSQHGFADLPQLDLLLSVTRLGPGNRALDVGCGSGLIAEYLSDKSGAHITGLDFIEEAIGQARGRTAAKADRLQFMVGDMNALELPPQSFDTLISIDTLYFPADLPGTIRQLKEALRPGAQMAIFFSHGWEPWNPPEEFDASTLAPDATPLGQALAAHGLHFRTWDLTAEDYRLARLRMQVLEELEPRFEAEGIGFIYENRIGDSKGISHAIECGLHKRYLYHVSVQ